MATLPPEYCLTATVLRKMCQSMASVSVTFEHLGIMNAAAAVRSVLTGRTITNELARNVVPAARNFGRVLDAWEAADGGFWATVVVPPLPGLEWLIKTKQLGACSLTHVMADATTATPLELSLVGVPARPGCLIRLATTSALKTAMYKAATLEGSKPSMSSDGKPETTKPTTATVAAAAIEELPAGPRELVVAKLANLVSAVDAANKRADLAEAGITERTKELQAANSAMVQQKLMADVDLGLLGAQIKQLCDAMPKDMLQNFSVTADGTIDAFTSGNPAQMATSALRTIMCANAAMMNHRSLAQPKAEESGSKRARVEQPPIQEHIATTPTPEIGLSQDQLLARALFDSFETPAV
jgi:hypothetical protein